MIVEDEEKIARFLELELRHEGYEADKASNGREGLDKALTGQYALMVLDVMLPELMVLKCCADFVKILTCLSLC